MARCSFTEDVVAAVRYALEAGLEIAVRCGGHSVSGASSVDDGVVIDLTGMKTVDVDPAGERATAGGGGMGWLSGKYRLTCDKNIRPA